MTKLKHPLTNRLAQFGLTDNDSEVYLLLLERGVALGGSKLATRLGIHRQYVYHSLQKLLALELVEQVGKEPRPKYQALSPQQLTHIARKRLQDTQTTVRELEMLSSVGANQDFEIYRGRQQIVDFEENLVESLPQGETQYIIGGGAEAFITFYGDDYERISKIADQHKLRTQYVGCKEEREWLERAKRVLKDFDYRLLPAMPQTRVQTVIRFDTVTFYSFGTPPLVYIIKSPSVYQDYKKFFEMLWNINE